METAHGESLFIAEACKSLCRINAIMGSANKIVLKIVIEGRWDGRELPTSRSLVNGTIITPFVTDSDSFLQAAPPDPTKAARHCR